MAVGYPEKMRAANGKVATYTATPGSNRPEPPRHPHPDAFLTINGSYNAGRGISPCSHRPLAQRIAQYTEALGYAPGDDDEGMAVSGDATTRLARQQCWDDIITRAPAKSYTGSEPCQEPSCPHPQPHSSGSWIHHSPWDEDRDPAWGSAYFRDIAHVLYPGGVLPTPIRDEPEPEPEQPAPPEPEQLDLISFLEGLPT